MHAAAMLARRFSLTTVLESARPMLSNWRRCTTVSESMASIRVVDISVLEISADLARLNAALAHQAGIDSKRHKKTQDGSTTFTSRSLKIPKPPCLLRVPMHLLHRRPDIERCFQFWYGRAESARPAGCPSVCK
jgi:hypothetical protein